MQFSLSQKAYSENILENPEREWLFSVCERNFRPFR